MRRGQWLVALVFASFLASQDFSNWLSKLCATAQTDQDMELTAHTCALDAAPAKVPLQILSCLQVCGHGGKRRVMSVES